MRFPDHLQPVAGHEECEYAPLDLDSGRKGFVDRTHRRYQLGGSSFGKFTWRGNFALGVPEWEAVVSAHCAVVDFVARDTGRVYRIDVGRATTEGWIEETTNGLRYVIPKALAVRLEQPTLF
jgi:hypothetical protein